MGMCETVETVEKYIENEDVSSISTYLLPSQGQHRPRSCNRLYWVQAWTLAQDDTDTHK